MDLKPCTLKSQRGRRCAALILLVLLFFQCTAAVAESAKPVPVMSRPNPAAATPLLGWSLGRAFSRVETFLSNRARMVQMATIGMCIGLYILMRR